MFNYLGVILDITRKELLSLGFEPMMLYIYIKKKGFEPMTKSQAY